MLTKVLACEISVFQTRPAYASVAWRHELPRSGRSLSAARVRSAEWGTMSRARHAVCPASYQHLHTRKLASSRETFFGSTHVSRRRRPTKSIPWHVHIPAMRIEGIL